MQYPFTVLLPLEALLNKGFLLQISQRIMVIWFSIYDHFWLNTWAHQVWELNSWLQLSERDQVHTQAKTHTETKEQDSVESVVCADAVLQSLISSGCVRVIDCQREIKDEGAAYANQKPLPSFGKNQEYKCQCENRQAEYLGPKSKLKVNGCTCLVIIFVGYGDSAFNLVLVHVVYRLVKQSIQFLNLWIVHH